VSAPVTYVAPDDIVMIADIAERLKVSKTAIQGWMRRPDFPRPITRLKAGNVYDYGAIVLWRQKVLEERRERLEREEERVR